MVWLLAVLILGLWGSWAGPAWNPQPMTNLIVPSTSSTEVTSAVDTPELGTYEVRETIHDVPREHGEPMRVTLREPVGAEGQRPGVVFLHGTGTSTHEAFAEHATWLASTGIVTAVPDKNLDGYSTLARDYESLADGYHDVAKWLRSQPSVYERDVGYYGESEGALIAPISTVRDPRTAFLILVSDPVMPIREQGALAADTYLREIGAPKQLYLAIPRLISGAIADGNFAYANFDPSPYHRKITVPVFMAYGTRDISMPIVQGPIMLARDLAEANNRSLLVRYYDGADHGLRIDGELQSAPYRDIADFINGLPSSVYVSDIVAGAQPRQDYVAQTVDTPRWFGSGHAMLVTLAAGVTLTIVGAGLLIVGKLPVGARQNYQGVGRPMVTSSAAILLTWVVFIVYVVALAELALSYETNRWVVQGGWLILQILALGAVYLLVRALRIWRANRMETRWAAVSLFILTAGQTLLLFALAYWGVYPSVLN
ncbi:Alpha/beta hydrolase family [Trueperella bialowiezensis]|uniref:Alpha/beta hydrolase family n=1 Tax=Trueperella bialowiezensis TaxID=312285 RepID=A0A448PGT9_9ACTO|nr:Alpha/beta hydrolase family [Trueperella bialowiezensis]